MFTSDSDTIAAIATPVGSGGVGIVRISGSNAPSIVQTLFVSSSPSFTGFKPRYMHHGSVVAPARHEGEAAQMLDEVLVVVMPGPHSFTGEDVAEVHCHGGPAVVAAVLEHVLACGARAAAPGEFSKRAYLNGRLDLTQAEAIAEIISAPTAEAATLAQKRLHGGLRTMVNGLRAQLEELRAKLCVAVDFPDDDVECLSPEEFLAGVYDVQQAIAGLVQEHERTRPFREGAMVVLAGRVNAGKSSLLNALLGRTRAIVTDVPGTTRDFLEESVNLGGIAVRLVDTAGLRETGDIVEQEGVRMSRDLAHTADLVLLVVDGSCPIEDADMELARTLGADKVLVAANKLDGSAEGCMPDVPVAFDVFSGLNIQVEPVSAKSGQGVPHLAEAVRSRLVHGVQSSDTGRIAPNGRQNQALVQTLAELEELAQDIQMSVPYDLMGVRLEAACSLLAEITGEITPQAVLNSIFDSFCIGK